MCCPVGHFPRLASLLRHSCLGSRTGILTLASPAVRHWGMCTLDFQQFNYISRESWTMRNVLWSRASVCVSVCLPVRGRMPTVFHGPGYNFGEWYGMTPSCALLGGFAIDARVALLWQHYGNAWQCPAVIRQAHMLTTHTCEDSPRRQ